MKKILLSLLIGVMMLGLTGCGDDEVSRIGDISNIEINNNNILVSIKEGTLTNTGATFIIKNNSNRVLRYGDSYCLEIKQDGLWHQINVQLDVLAPLWELSINDSTYLNIVWENSYGVLEPGEYRFIKDVSFENEDGTFDDFYIGVEFVIE